MTKLIVRTVMLVLTVSVNAQAQDCSSIAEKVCYQDTANSPCHDTVRTPQFIAALTQVCTQFPAPLRSLLLSLDRISIGPLAQGVARADTRLIDINEKVFDSSLSLSRLLTWKEQMSFGGSSEFAQVTLPYPIILARIPGWRYEALSYAIIHELGHVWSERVMDDDFSTDGACLARPGTWSSYSWLSENDHGDTPRRDKKFRGMNVFVFYRPGKKSEKISDRTLLRAYKGLYGSSFVTAYATQSHAEDFAESFAFTILERTHALQYVVSLPGGVQWNVVDKLSLPQFVAKKNWLHALFDNPRDYPLRAVDAFRKKIR